MTAKPILLVLFLSGLTLPALSQLTVPGQESATITVRISNNKKEPVGFATVTIENRTDSSMRATKTADSSGRVQFTVMKNSQYTVYISSVNYHPLEKGIAVTGAQSSFQFILEPLGKTLEAAVVTSKKPLMKQEDDKLIVDPANLAEASTNGFEVIEKTPGLFVDQDGNVYISSMTPATVQINGRDMKMSASDIATLLKNLPPNSIARIEVVKTPSARYEASGSGGIVNVVLKKGVRIGMTGSVNGGWQQGKYANEFLGLNLNNNNGKKSSYLNLNIGKRNNYERIVTDRIFAPDTMLSQDANTVYPANSAYAALGTTWEAGKKWELTYDGHFNYNDFNNTTRNGNSIRKISTSGLVSNSLNTITNEGYYYSAGSGFESKYKIDSAGSEWSTDSYFTHSENKADQDYITLYYSPFADLLSGDGLTRNRRNYFTTRTDLKLKMKDRFTFEGGLQSTISSFHNSSNYFREDAGSRIKDNSRTNSFRYNENINSLYAQGSKTLGKDIIAKFGARLENTNMKGRQIIPSDTSFSIHRTDIFPYIYLSRNLMKIAGYDLRAYLVYRRSIRRPSYEQLNPFRRYVDEFMTETGNPSLRPQFTQNYEANISVDERPILAVGINNTKDIFTNVVYQSDTSNKQAFRTYDNLGKNKEWYFRGMGALPPGGRYFFVLGAQYNHNFYQGLYENKPLSFKKGTWTFFTYQTFKIDKLSQLSLNGFMRLNGQQQFYELSSFGALNLSLNRRFLKEKLVVTASVNDVFFTNKNDFNMNQGSITASGFRQSDTRRFGLNFRYNFGIRKKEENNNLFNTEPAVAN